MSVDALVAAVLDATWAREPACGSSRVVAVDGPSGAGKTDLAARLQEASGAEVLHLDDLYPGWHGLEAAPPAVAAVLGSVATGDLGRARRWDWEHERPAGTLTLAPRPLIVVEGVGSAAAVVRPFLNLVVWVEAPAAVRRERALTRDGDTYRAWWHVWAAQERRHFARELTRGRADLVVRT